MARQVIRPQTEDPIGQSLGSIGSLVGGFFGGPAGGAAGGAVGGALGKSGSGAQQAPGGSAASRKQNQIQLQRGLNAAEAVGDANNSALIQEALRRADTQNQTSINQGTLQRRRQALGGA